MSRVAARLVDEDAIPWHIDARRNEDGSWTAEVYANGHGFGRSESQKSWRTAIDKAMTAASATRRLM